jgi:hypothetical protein
LDELPKFVTVDVALDDLIEAVYVSPECKEPVPSVVQALVSRYGLKAEVVRSSLQDPKVY